MRGSRSEVWGAVREETENPVSATVIRIPAAAWVSQLTTGEGSDN